MKALNFVGPEKVAMVEVPTPSPGPGEVVVRIRSAALCAADLDPYHGKSHAGVGAKAHRQVIPGHEGCGVIESIGPGVNQLQVGDRVAVYTFVSCCRCSECRAGDWMLCSEAKCFGFDLDGCDAELLLVPAQNCLKIPAWLDFDQGSLMTDLFGTTFTAAKKIQVSALDTVAIFGLGPIGVCATSICSALGADVIAIDVVEDRLTLARKFGADYTINSSGVDPVESAKNLIGSHGVTASIDCSGNAKAETDAIRIVASHGRVALVGWGMTTEIRPVDYLITKDVSIRGSWYFNISDFEEMVSFARRKRTPLREMITHRFPLDQATTAFQLFDQKKTLKTILVP